MSARESVKKFFTETKENAGKKEEEIIKSLWVYLLILLIYQLLTNVL